MTPEAKKSYLNKSDRPWGSAGSSGFPSTVRSSLAAMCEYGARLVAEGRYTAIDFNLMNEAEAEFVKAYMDEKHPGVPYRRKWMTFDAPA